MYARNFWFSYAVAFILVAIFASSAFGAVNTHGLTEQQKAHLEIEAAKMRANQIKQGNNILKMDPSQLKETVDVGTQIGKAIAGTAKELGIAVNDFAKTPVGILTVVIVVFYMFGGTVLGLTFASIFFPLSMVIWYKLYKAQVLEYTPDNTSRDFNMASVAFMYWLTFLAICLITIIAVFG